MKSYAILFTAFAIFNAITQVICSIDERSFLETDAGFRRIQRNLLQEDDGLDKTNDVSDGESATEKPEPVTEPPKKGIFEIGEDMTGT